MRSKILYILLPVILILFSGCGPALKDISKKPTNPVIQKLTENRKLAENWTLEECNAVIDSYKAVDRDGFTEKLRRDRTVSYADVFITVLPLNIPVINAIVRKEAIQRRLPKVKYRERLKEYFETYTNMTVDSATGNIQCRVPNGSAYNEEMSFIVTFENISSPYHVIELERAEEGFFLENSRGEFSRVIKSTGPYSDETFLLSGEIKLTLTFSLYQDNGKELLKSEFDFANIRLVFNGLQDEPVVIGSK